MMKADPSPQGWSRRNPSAASYPPGISAITPIRCVSDQATAAFDRADVERFLADQPLFYLAAPTAGEVATVLFVTASQASQWLHGTNIGRPDAALVCWVEVQGPLDLIKDISLPSGIKPLDGATIPPAQVGILVFDGQTGHLLVRSWGSTKRRRHD